MSTSSKNRQSAHLQIKDLCIRYGNGKNIIENLDLNLSPQTIYTLIGPSGSGKTSLLNVLAGIIQPSSGEIVWKDKNYQPKEHIIGLVPQDYGLLPWQTGRETLETNLKIRKKIRKLSLEDHQELDQMIASLKIDTVQHHYPIAMSGGQKQRFSLARAFSVDPDMLLMDEPFSALDAMTREQTQQLFLSIWNKRPNLTLFITHDIEEALLIGHDILMFSKDGKLMDTLKNPLARLPYNEKRDSTEFFELSKKLRKDLQKNEPAV